ncbi:MAG TPA: FlgD immunoglobulin-like domain containing protein [Candidatus Krumholzibacteria bacterium]|nr:FlgD immunoglobulin-like domain containing protein [Candidatus Krumholzibacteria bacterium]
MRPSILRHRAVAIATLAALLIAAASALAADPGDECWSEAYPPAGIVGTVRSMVSHTGVLYVAGSFNAVGTTPLANIAALVTTATPEVAVVDALPLGDGLDGTVYDLCDFGGGIAAVGAFTHSGTQALDHVALWDGAAWQDLGGGLPFSTPRAVASFQGDLYAGAYRWDGDAWENVLQTNATVLFLEVVDGLLYAGGSFTTARGDSVAYLTAWDGQQLVDVGGGFPYPVSAMTATADALYAFGDDGYYGYRALRRWDGATWTEESTTLWPDALGVYDGDVYAATTVMVIPHHYVYVLQSNAGGAWHQVAAVHPGAMIEHDGRLVLQADAGEVDTLFTPGLAAFDGSTVRDVFPASGFSGGYRALAPYGQGLVVGGSCTIAAGARIDGAALHMGDTWFPAGSPDDIATSYPSTLIDLQCVGTSPWAVFEWIDWDIAVHELARLVWQGDRFGWQRVATPDYSLSGLQAAGPWLYSFGYQRLYRIDPATGTFADMGAFTTNGALIATTEADGQLIAAGSFTTINGVTTGNVARLTGGAWVGIGSTVPGLNVAAVAGTEPGRFAAAVRTTYSVHNVWAFDGTDWSMLPGDFNGAVEEVVYHRGRIFALGRFTQAGPTPASGIALWTGERWAAVGSGLGGGSYGDLVTDARSDGTNLIIAGSFTHAGGRPSCGLAEWTGDPTLFTGIPSGVPEAPADRRLLGDARPNPFNPRTTIALTLPTAGHATVAVYDLRGRRVCVLVDGALEAGTHALTWDGADDAGRAMPSGVYFARATAAGSTGTTKLALVR